MILTEECNNIIVVYLLCHGNNFHISRFFNIFINFFSVFHGLLSFFLFVITIIRSILKIAII